MHDICPLHFGKDMCLSTVVKILGMRIGETVKIVYSEPVGEKVLKKV